MPKNKTIGKKIVIGLITLFFGVGFIPVISNAATSATLTFNPTDDAYIIHRSGQTNQNFGDIDFMEVENFSGASGIWGEDSLVKFDISFIPADTTIKSATLYLYYHSYSANNPSGRDLNLYRIKSAWYEDTVTWEIHPSYASQPTDYATVPSSTGVWMSWDVTSDVQNFVDGQDNYGWKISDDNGWGGANIPVTSFRTKEYGDYIPYLEIESLPATVYVDDDYCDGCDNDGHIWGYDAFDNIQDGIDIVLENGAVYVYSGTYYEHVTVNKTINLIGENKYTTIIDGSGSGDVVYVTADSVSINGFAIQNGGSGGGDYDQDTGLKVNSNHNVIKNNNIIYNGRDGLLLYSSSNNIISNNSISSNDDDAMIIYNSNSNLISDNIISSNDDNGIIVYTPSTDNTISGNTISSNNDDGLYILSPNNKIYHNNFIDNLQNAQDEGTNTWYNVALQQGNYWGDYTGVDDNCDGIGDTPYNIPGGSNQDLYPFMNQDGWDNQAPIADADGPYYANVNSVITFDGSGSTDSDGTVAGYRWDWTNDGAYDTGWLTSATTTHSYSSAGIYTVKLQVKDDGGVCDTDTAKATISPEGPTPIPTADANGPYSGYVNYSVTFDSSGSTGGAGATIVSWYWTFGDGAASSQQYPTHTYTTDGTYTVTLKVTNNYDETNTDTTTATITEISEDQTPPVADSGGPYVGVVNELITFDGSNSNDSDGAIVGYEWNFGDGTTDAGISPTHTYTTAGNYTVILTVTDDDTLTHSNSTTANINVSGPPTIVIFVDVSNIEPIEEENEKTIPVTVFCYHQTVSNIHLEILEYSNLTINSLSPNITLEPEESKELLIKIKAPKLKETNNLEGELSDETIILQAVGDDNITSNTEQINLKVIEKNATPGFDTIATITAVGTAGALVAFFRRRNGIR